MATNLTVASVHTAIAHTNMMASINMIFGISNLFCCWANAQRI
jgi:hypothetical protein